METRIVREKRGRMTFEIAKTCFNGWGVLYIINNGYDEKKPLKTALQ